MFSQTATVEPSDKRSDIRLSCRLTVIPRLASGTVLNDEGQALIHDLSPGGVGLLLPERLDDGTRLVVEIPAQGGTRPWEVRVLWATAQADGRWLHGCESACELPANDLLAAVVAGAQSKTEVPDGAVTPVEDSFVVLVRPAPEEPQVPIARCRTQEEARSVKEQFRDVGLECIIRFTGPAGGGD